jgi:hypothetical protein
VFQFLASLLLVVVVFKFFKSLMGTDQNRERMEETVKRHRMRTRQKAESKAQVGAEDMAECPVCNAYVPKSAAACQRSDCPKM